MKQLVELQNGQIYVKSKFGYGSEFYFTLEFKKVDSSIVKIIEGNNSNKKSLEKLSILLCEDNELNQHLAKNVIQNFGFDLDIANNGQEGIDLLIKNKYDLILMDLQMPVMDGYQTTIYIRNELKNEIPIIAMTAHSLVGEQQKCFDIGMNAYVAKPFKQQDLLNEIHSVIEINAKKQLEISNDEQILAITQNKKNIDLSYLDELSGGNNDFRNEMLELFITKIPKDLNLLENAIHEKDYIVLKSIAHEMKSSLTMFRLDDEFALLEQIEKKAINSTISSESMDEFVNFKNELKKVTDTLTLFL